MILMGGSSEAAARRAARLGLGFFPAVGDPHLEEVVSYSSTVGRAALQMVPALGGFLAALVLLPSRWLAITALFVSLSCLFGHPE